MGRFSRAELGGISDTAVGEALELLVPFAHKPAMDARRAHTRATSEVI